MAKCYQGPQRGSRPGRGQRRKQEPSHVCSLAERQTTTESLTLTTAQQLLL